MAMPTKIVFPLPPPTTNALSAQQRSQLLRKTKKLEQILGAAPHLVDTPSSEALAPIHVTLPKSTDRDTLHRTSSQTRHRRTPSLSLSLSDYSRSSIDSFSSASSSAHSASPLTSPSSLVVAPKRGNSLSRSSSTSSTLKKANPAPRRGGIPVSPSYETWSDTKPPFLRLSLKNGSEVESALGLHFPNSQSVRDSHRKLSPSAIEASISNPLPDGSHLDPVSQQYTLSPSTNVSTADLSLSPAPSFNIVGNTRKNKMDRLRRRLGHDVPVELVFPNETQSESGEGFEFVEKEGEGEMKADFVFPAPTALIPRKKKTVGTIKGSRDSITGETIRASRRKDSSKALPPLPLLPPPSSYTQSSQPLSPSSSLSSSSSSEERGKLAVIIESPDEHGFGCAEEFGISRAHRRSVSLSMNAGEKRLSAQWVGKTGSATTTTDAEIRLWSTRKGYEGWAVPLSDVVDIGKPSETAGSEVKGSWSYRKPPPSVEL